MQHYHVAPIVRRQVYPGASRHNNISDRTSFRCDFIIIVLVSLKLISDRLFRDDVFCLRTFLSLRHFHRDLLTLFQGLESFHLNCSVVYEYIRTAFMLDETKSLIIVEPLDGSFNSFT